MAEYQKLYNHLRSAGLSEAGALGVLGNWDCESNCEPCRVQGDFSSFRSVSKAYVASLESGALTKQRFMNDQKGFGVAQWTYFSRKGELYDFWKSTGLPIDSAELQVKFAVKELKRDFAADFQIVCSTNDIYQATKVICARFENPAVHNIDARFQAATRIKFQINLNNWQETSSDAAESAPVSNTETEPESVDSVPKTEYWPPRDIDRNMMGDDVSVLQAVLKARGYSVSAIDGNFGSELEISVKKFQAENGLTADGIVGPKSWRKLLEI